MQLHDSAHLVGLKLLDHTVHRLVQRHLALLPKLVHKTLPQPVTNIGRHVIRADGFQNPVCALAYQSLFVKLYLIRRELPQFACESPQSLLEELVDSAYRKCRIVVKYVFKQFGSPFLHLGHSAEGWGKLLDIRRLIRFVRQTVQLFKDTVFHFSRSLVGKGHGKYMTICKPVVRLQQKPNVCLCKVVGLTRTRTGA